MKKNYSIDENKMLKIFLDSELVLNDGISGYYYLIVDILDTINIKDRAIIFKKFTEVLNELDLRKREILFTRYGLSTGKTMTLSVLGKKYGLTNERARQIVEEAIEELRRKKVEYSIYHRVEYLKLKVKEMEEEIHMYEKLCTFEEAHKITVRDFNFTNRAMNALNDYGVNTYEELINLTPQELIGMKNIGIKTANDIWFKLHNEEIYKYICRRVGGIPFSTRAANILIANGITTNEELSIINADTLRKMKGIGKKTFKEIIGKVRAHR